MTSDATLSKIRCANPDCPWESPPGELILLCPQCGDLTEVVYEWPAMDPAGLKETFRRRMTSHNPEDRSGVWRFRELLPFWTDLQRIVTLQEGNTPLYDTPQSARYAGIRHLQLKHLGFNPTGAFQDYGMSAAMTQAHHHNVQWVACASTGNTSASMAAYAARAGIRSLVIVPAEKVSPSKLSQALEHGALTLEIEGSYDIALRLAYQVCQLKGICLLNSFNPFRIEGQKAILFEILERFEWDPPDWIVLPGGNLGNCAAFGKALSELRQLGLIDRLPRLALIQPENACAFHQLWKKKNRMRLQPVEPNTLATAINVGNPVSWKKAVKSLTLTDGVCEQVSEHEIANAKAIIGREGIGCEPASAASLAGIKKLAARGVIARDARIVGILTGHVLKDCEYTLLYHGDPETIGSTSKGRAFVRTGIKARFANYPVRINANKEAILKILDERYPPE
jgi:threonine synthase